MNQHITKFLYISSVIKLMKKCYMRRKVKFLYQATVFLQLFCLVFITLELNAQLLESMTTSFYILNFYDSILYNRLEESNRYETCYKCPKINNKYISTDGICDGFLYIPSFGFGIYGNDCGDWSDEEFCNGKIL